MESDRWLGLDLRHLVALKTIADEGSFGRAAERLGYTQSAISQQIAALERIVGLRLIERPGGPRPISLTEAGQILLRHADAIQARLLAAKADMAALEAGDLDLTFWTLPVAGGPYETVELLHDPYVLVLPAGSPLATSKRPPTLK